MNKEKIRLISEIEMDQNLGYEEHDDSNKHTENRPTRIGKRRFTVNMAI